MVGRRRRPPGWSLAVGGEGPTGAPDRSWGTRGRRTVREGQLGPEVQVSRTGARVKTTSAKGGRSGHPSPEDAQWGTFESRGKWTPEVTQDNLLARESTLGWTVCWYGEGSPGVGRTRNSSPVACLRSVPDPIYVSRLLPQITLLLSHNIPCPISQTVFFIIRSFSFPLFPHLNECLYRTPGPRHVSRLSDTSVLTRSTSRSSDALVLM